MKWMALSALVVSIQAQSFCFEEAGREFDVNPKLLEAICFTESSLNPYAVNDNNQGGSVDVGLCQVNSWWFPKLKAYGVSQDDLLHDACLNTRVSAWILAQNFDTSGEGWLAVGAYNAGYSKKNQAARERYIALVKKNLSRLP